MAIAYVGTPAHNFTTTGTVTSKVIPITTATTAGNRLVLVFCTGMTNTTAPTVTDSKGNTWTIDAGPFVGGTDDYVFIASTPQNVGPLTTSDTVTVTLPVATTSVAQLWRIMEFSGIAASSAVDVVAHNSSASTSASGTSGTTAATAQASELAVAGFCAANFNSTGGAAGTGYTDPNGYAAANVTDYEAIGAEYQILSATGTQSAGYTFNTTGPSGGAASYVGCIVCYKAAGGTTFTATLTSSVTTTATLAKKLSALRTLTASVTTSPTVAKGLAILRTLTAGVTTSVTAPRSVLRTFTAGVTTTPTLARSKVAFSVLSAVVSTIDPGFPLWLSGSGATVTKQANVTRSSSVTTTPSVSTFHPVSLLLTATATVVAKPIMWFRRLIQIAAATISSLSISPASPTSPTITPASTTNLDIVPDEYR